VQTARPHGRRVAQRGPRTFKLARPRPGRLPMDRPAVSWARAPRSGQDLARRWRMAVEVRGRRHAGGAPVPKSSFGEHTSKLEKQKCLWLYNRPLCSPKLKGFAVARPGRGRLAAARCNQGTGAARGQRARKPRQSRAARTQWQTVPAHFPIHWLHGTVRNLEGCAVPLRSIRV
jgi:hypothetical protein